MAQPRHQPGARHGGPQPAVGGPAARSAARARRVRCGTGPCAISGRASMASSGRSAPQCRTRGRPGRRSSASAVPADRRTARSGVIPGWLPASGQATHCFCRTKEDEVGSATTTATRLARYSSSGRGMFALRRGGCCAFAGDAVEQVHSQPPTTTRGMAATARFKTLDQLFAGSRAAELPLLPAQPVPVLGTKRPAPCRPVDVRFC